MFNKIIYYLSYSLYTKRKWCNSVELFFKSESWLEVNKLINTRSPNRVIYEPTEATWFQPKNASG